MKEQSRGATRNEWHSGQWLLSAALALAFASRLVACGPFFPNWLLGEGDTILAAPFASFAAEIARLNPPPTRYAARLTTNDHPKEILNAELSDLRAALIQAGRAPAEIGATLQTHTTERQKLTAFAEEMRIWFHASHSNTNLPPPVLPKMTEVRGLPGEFADYLHGCVAWHRGDTNSARAAWSALLARPKQQRQFKSTWAAYMLGRSWEDESPAKAIRFYQQVRTLVDDGFTDTDGLAVASIGREARLRYLAGEYQRAIDLYLQQQASGDDATTSLRWVAAAALHAGPSALKPLARDPTARRVITAYLIAGGFRDPETDVDGPVGELVARGMEKANVVSAPRAGWHKMKAPALMWLEAIESADVRDSKEAEQFGLAAYQAGKFEQATRWLDRAPLNPATRWLRAKLLLRNGKVNEAAALLSAVVRKFPLGPHDQSAGAPRDSALDWSFASGYSGDSPSSAIPPANRALGELGAVRLSRREYTEALDALLRSGFWMDAAYVGERVLTLEELKTYVNRLWPELPPATNTYSAELSPDDEAFHRIASVEEVTANIRYLLARRLLRAERFNEARPLLPSGLRPTLDEWRTNLLLGTDSRQPGAARAEALWQAAQVLRRDGMELIGTEVEPDWRVHGGEFEEGVALAGRTNSLLRASEDEVRRARQHGVNPEERFHYRYVAANVAWEAAKLMPDNKDATARVLCTAGSWLKDRDPKAADVFYKALVNRCRKTAIGAEAERKRWFPILDETGHLKPIAPTRVPAGLRN